MPNDDQAQADAKDTMTVADPLDPANSQIGTSRLAEFEAELQSAMNPRVEEVQGVEPAAEELVEIEQEEQEQEEPQEEEPVSEEEQAPPVKTTDRFRFKDPVDQAVAAIAKAKGISLLEAAKIFEGQNPTERRETTEEFQEEAPAVTVASVEARIQELEELDAHASSELQFEEALQHRLEANKLRNQLLDLKIEEREAKKRKEQEQQSQYDAEWVKSTRMAVAYYPDTTKADSPLVKRMEEINARMERLGDPIFHSPNKPFQLAKLAARELGIPMADPKAPVQKRTTTRPVNPASGNARTTTTDPAKRTSDVIDGIKTTADFEKLVAGIGS